MRNFRDWQRLQGDLPSSRPSEKTLLIIRLDDIGDYLLFRNHLRMYRRSVRWRDHFITLLGNESWRELLTALDAEAVDDTIWVEKNEYLGCAAYRLKLWKRLRDRGFETVIAPSRTRPLLFDDLCMLAAAPRRNIASANTYVHARWNRVSDPLYQEIFRPSDPMIHEFHFNAEFAAWACGTRYEGRRPQIEPRFHAPHPGSYIICFVGANTRSKRWPTRRWIDFIRLYRHYYSSRIILAGRSADEMRMALAIQARTGAESIAGKVSLPELLRWVAGAQAVLTNDTMAAHLAASSNRPTVIIANGVNYTRFTEYEKAGIENVATAYPAVFSRRRAQVGELSYAYTDAISSDIASITAQAVLEKLEHILRVQRVSEKRLRPLSTTDSCRARSSRHT